MHGDVLTKTGYGLNTTNGRNPFGRFQTNPFSFCIFYIACTRVVQYMHRTVRVRENGEFTYCTYDGTFLAVRTVRENELPTTSLMGNKINTI